MPEYLARDMPEKAGSTIVGGKELLYFDGPLGVYIAGYVQGKRYELRLEQLEKTFDAPIVAVIPEEKKVPESIAAGVPLMAYAKFSNASTEMKKLAAKLAGEKYKPAGVFARFKDFLVGERFDFEQKPEEFLEKATE